MRGIVDEAFVQAALQVLPDGTEYCVLEQAATGNWWSGETHAELREELAALSGARIALGPYPPWLDQGDAVLAAYVPDADGTVRPSAY